MTNINPQRDLDTGPPQLPPKAPEEKPKSWLQRAIAAVKAGFCTTSVSVAPAEPRSVSFDSDEVEAIVSSFGEPFDHPALLDDIIQFARLANDKTVSPEALKAKWSLLLQGPLGPIIQRAKNPLIEPANLLKLVDAKGDPLLDALIGRFFDGLAYELNVSQKIGRDLESVIRGAYLPDTPPKQVKPLDERLAERFYARYKNDYTNVYEIKDEKLRLALAKICSERDKNFQAHKGEFRLPIEF